MQRPSFLHFIELTLHTNFYHKFSFYGCISECTIVCHPVPWGLHCSFIQPGSCRNVPRLHPAHIPQLSLPRKRRGERPVDAKVLLHWGAGMWPGTGSQVPSVDVDYDTIEFLRKYHTNLSYLRADFSTCLHQCKSGATALASSESFQV